MDEENEIVTPEEEIEEESATPEAVESGDGEGSLAEPEV